MEKKRPSNPSNVFLFSREKLTASGVLEVTGFDELQIEAKTEQGLLLIRGHDNDRAGRRPCLYGAGTKTKLSGPFIEIA